MFRRSDLFGRIKADSHGMFPNNSQLLGDAAYLLMINLMVPYKDNGSLSHQQMKFNQTLFLMLCD